MWYYGMFGLPDWAPQKWGKDAVHAYWQYLRERERDLAEGVKPSTDTVTPWGEFLAEYLHAELEAAD